MFSVIIWKQNIEKLYRTGAIAPLPPFGPITIPSTITISALTSKLLRNSRFSERHRVFLVFLYQIDTSNDFRRQYFPFCMNIIFYAIASFSIAKIEKYLRTKCHCFFILNIHAKFPENRIENTDLPIVPPPPHSQIQIWDFTQNGEGCNSKRELPIHLKFILYFPLD